MSMEDDHRAYLESQHWKDLREAVFLLSGRMCEACSSEKHLQGHHIVYRIPLSQCTASDVIALCKKCHSMWHKWLDSNSLTLRDFTRAGTIRQIRKINNIDPLEVMARARNKKLGDKIREHNQGPTRPIQVEHVVKWIDQRERRKRDGRAFIELLLQSANE